MLTDSIFLALLFQLATATSVGTISGRVIDDAGAPFPEITAQLSVAGDWAFIARTQTDANGKFTFSGLTASTYEVYFQEKGANVASIKNVKALAGQFTTTSMR